MSNRYTEVMGDEFRAEFVHVVGVPPCNSCHRDFGRTLLVGPGHIATCLRHLLAATPHKRVNGIAAAIDIIARARATPHIRARDEPRGDEPRGDEPRGDEPRGDEPRGARRPGGHDAEHEDAMHDWATLARVADVMFDPSGAPAPARVVRDAALQNGGLAPLRAAAMRVRIRAGHALTGVPYGAVATAIAMGKRFFDDAIELPALFEYAIVATPHPELFVEIFGFND
jgi:hypothetical protein